MSEKAQEGMMTVNAAFSAEIMFTMGPENPTSDESLAPMRETQSTSTLPIRVNEEEEEEKHPSQDSVAHSECASCETAADNTSAPRSTSQPSDDALVQIRQRNALYSKRKYYKRKQEVQRLEMQRHQLQVNNQKLRSDNEQLEQLLRAVHRQIEESLSNDNAFSVPLARYSQQSLRSAARMPQPLHPAVATHLGARDEAFLRQHLLQGSSQQYTAAEVALLGSALNHQYHPLASLHHSSILSELTHPPFLSNDIRIGSHLPVNPSDDMLRLLSLSSTLAPDLPPTHLLAQYLQGVDVPEAVKSLPQFNASSNLLGPSWTQQSEHALFRNINHRTEQQQQLLELLRHPMLPGTTLAEEQLLRLLHSKQRESLPLTTATPNSTTELLRQLLDQQKKAYR